MLFILLFYSQPAFHSASPKVRDAPENLPRSSVSLVPVSCSPEVFPRMRCILIRMQSKILAIIYILFHIFDLSNFKNPQAGFVATKFGSTLTDRKHLQTRFSLLGQNQYTPTSCKIY